MFILRCGLSEVAQPTFAKERPEVHRAREARRAAPSPNGTVGQRIIVIVPRPVGRVPAHLQTEQVPARLQTYEKL